MNDAADFNIKHAAFRWLVWIVLESQDWRTGSFQMTTIDGVAAKNAQGFPLGIKIGKNKKGRLDRVHFFCRITLAIGGVSASQVARTVAERRLKNHLVTVRRSETLTIFAQGFKHRQMGKVNRLLSH